MLLSGQKKLALGPFATRALLLLQVLLLFAPSAVCAASPGYVSVAAGLASTLALSSDGMLFQWGDNLARQTLLPAGSGAVAVSAGAAHTLALKSDGSVLAWGLNDRGQASVPAALSGVVAVAAGSLHSVALKSDGSVVAFGDDSRGQSSVPAAARSGVVAVAAGWYHTAALKADGSVLAWGMAGAATVPAAAQSDVISIAAGGGHTLALKRDGSVLAWGLNDVGQCLVPASALSGVVAIAAGAGHSLALKGDGSVVAWGLNRRGQTAIPPRATRKVVALAAGGSHSVALRNDGSLVTWGSDQFGAARQAALAVAPAGLLKAGDAFSVDADIADVACSWDAASFPSACSLGSFPEASSITLTARLSAETALDWTGCDAATPTTCTVTSLASDRTIVATLSAKSPQQISFDPPAQLTYGDAPVTLAATGGGSGNPVRFEAAGPATLAGDLLTLTGAGTVTVTARQDGSPHFLAAPPVTKSFSVAKAVANLALDPASLQATFDGGAKSVRVTGLPSASAVTPADLTVTYDGLGFAPVAAGSYLVQATLNHPDYRGSAGGTLVIAKASQGIAFDPSLPAAVSYGVGPISLAATGGGSGNPVRISVAGPGQLAGNLLSVTGAGEIVLRADQAGDGNFDPAPTLRKTMLVAKAPATLIFDAATLHQSYDGSAKQVVLRSATVGLDPNPAQISLSYDGGAAAPVSAGSYSVTALLDHPDFQASATATLTIDKAPQQISFTPPAAATFGDPLIPLAATGGGSGNPVTFAVLSGPALLAGSGLVLTGAGEVTLLARQQGDANHLAAPELTRTILVEKAPVALSFDPATLARLYDGAPKEPAVRSASAGFTPTAADVVYRYDGSPNPPVAAGTYAVQATLAHPNYRGEARGTLVIAPAPQSILFDPGLPATLTYRAPPLTLAATGGGSGNPVRFGVVQGPGALQGSSLVATGAGEIVIRAEQAGDANFAAAAEVRKVIAVTKAGAVLTLAPATLNRQCDGLPKPVTVESSTPGLDLGAARLVVTYAGSATAPAAAGSYPVLAVLDDPNFEGSVTGTLTLTDPAPTVTSFVVPGLSGSLSVPIATLAASDNVAVTGFLVTESPVPPPPDHAGWNAAPPASYSFGAAGLKTLYAFARDGAGNVSAPLSAAVTVDLTGPSLTLEGVAAPFTVSPARLFGSVSDPGGVASVSVGIGSAPAVAATVSGGSWTLPLAPLSEGNTPVTVQAWDRAGNRAQVEGTLVFDATPPALSVTSVVTVSAATAQTIGGTVSDAGGVDAVLVQVGEKAAVPALVTGGSWSCRLSDLAEGEHLVAVTARDRAGNLSPPVIRKVAVDRSAPELTLDPVPSYTARPSVTLSGTVRDWAGVGSLTVQSGGVESEVVLAGERWSHSLTLPSGEARITLRAADRAGNVATVTARTVRVGDLNGDGVVDVADALLSMQLAVGSVAPTELQRVVGDVAPLANGLPAPDGAIDTGDALVLLMIAVGTAAF